MNKVVLDASALLALLYDEIGADNVIKYLPNATISSVNLAEVLSKLIEAGMSATQAKDILNKLNLDITIFSEDIAYITARLRPITKQQGLSLGDRACLATALYLQTTAITADKQWRNLNIEINIECIR
ncbi:twitching motility protein PilT [Achromatium sp. WMS3]|nr:twitching motility protein PilT [Achromatium sp. WMS3]